MSFDTEERIILVLPIFRDGNLTRTSTIAMTKNPTVRTTEFD